MRTPFDPIAIRKDFPMLAAADAAGKRLAFLDTAASSQTPTAVLEAEAAFYRECRANVHRGMYRASSDATERYEKARHAVADFIHASDDEIVFTRGTTDGLNLVASGLATNLGPGDEVVLTQMEHHANLVPWQQHALRRGFSLKFIPVNKTTFELDMTAAAAMIGPSTKVVAFTYVSNVLGTVVPAIELIALARGVSAITVVDAAQAMGHIAIDVRKLDCDFLAFSGHKMLGPTGIGVLYGKKSRLEALAPVQFGGDMIREVFWDHSTWNQVPLKFEAGTPNIAGAIGLGAAVDYIRALGIDRIAAHEHELTEMALEQLTAIPGMTIIGPTSTSQHLNTSRQNSSRAPVISFDLSGLHPHDLSTILDAEGVAVRGGHHCAMPLLRELGLASGTTRASFALYNTRRDVDALIAGIEKARRIFRLS